MRELPQRPDLDHLRRKARELYRAAAQGDAGAIRRIRALSKPLTLTSAQLAVAREYGFPSWARLKAEVDPRRRPHPALPQRGREHRNLDDWNRRIARRRFLNQAALRQWLANEGVTGYAQQLLAWERFGYPSFMTAGADDLIGRQYVDRAQLRPILDATLAKLPGIGPVAVVQARKTYISLVSKRRTFAVIQATTRNRVDLGLRLGKQRPGGRLKPGKGVGNGSLTVCLPLSAVADLDDEALSWLKRAYDENA